jgi:hypothetical protein
MVAICLTLSAVVPGSVGPALAQNTTDESMGRTERILRYLEQSSTVQPGVGLAGVTIGMPMNAVPALWGNPYRQDRTGVIKRRTILLYRSGIDAWIRVEGQSRVERIGIEGSTGMTTPEGVRFGMPHHQVRMILGPPGEITDNHHEYPALGIRFAYKSGTVYQMEIFEPPEHGS